jgi:guanylate kinase
VNRNAIPVALVLHGPGGVGKDTVVARLGLRRPVSTTDRPPRQGEADGVDYYFVHPVVFTALELGDQFAEMAPVLGYRKGLLRAEIDAVLATGQDFIIRTDFQGARTWKSALSSCITLQVLGLPADAPLQEHREDLLARLRKRGALPDEIDERLTELEIELADSANNDHVIVNRWDGVDRAVDQIRAILADAHRDLRRAPPTLVRLPR